MKKILSLLLLCTLTLAFLSGCSKKAQPADAATVQAGSFEPDTTAAPGGDTLGGFDSLSAGDATVAPDSGDMQEVVDATLAPSADAAQAAPSDATQAAPSDATQAVPSDAAQAAPSDAAQAAPSDAAQAAPSDAAQAAPTQRSNTIVTQYGQLSGTGLGFSMSYPAEWTNLPGRESVCYRQNITDGSAYPARVVVTMKKIAHDGNEKRLREQMVSYFKNLMANYDEKTFEIDTDLDATTKFMGLNAYSTTYLAYDGATEIKGYVIMTYYKKYVFCFHFQCAYDDFDAFASVMGVLRDSVQADTSTTLIQ